MHGVRVRLRVRALDDLFRDELSVWLPRIRADGPAAEPVVVVQATTRQKDVLVFG